ncbi:MAG: S8 family serine peptidase [Flavobacteriales bacterium]|nr:S8 family serine peptidase [Flavobacteriales bacterium]
MKFFFMSVAIAMTCFSSAQKNFDHNGGGFPLTEFVVKATDDLDALEKNLPEGTVVVSRHYPLNILTIINENLDESNFERALIANPLINYLDRAEADQTGNPILPTGLVIIQPQNGFETAAFGFCNALGCSQKQTLKSLAWTVFQLPKNLSYRDFESSAKNSGLFELIMRDEIILCEEHVSDDTFWTSCWYVSQASDNDIDADLAWQNLPAGAANAQVTIIDGHGFDVSHPDLAANIVDTYNAVNQTTIVTPGNTYEKHATACAGIPGALYNNALGIPGLGYNKIKIQAIQIGYNAQASGTFYTSSTYQANAINHAMSTGNTVAISMSFGGTTFQTTFYNAITSARTTARNGKGIPVFASTGNNGVTGWINYPASYAGVIAVGATTSLDTRSSFSNYGTGLILSAPGTAITTTDIAGTNGYSTTDYTNFSGTSAACPVAASVGAMVLIANPNLTETEVKTILAQSCEKVGGYSYASDTSNPYSTWSNELGYGRVNMNAAVLSAISTTTPNPDLTIGNYSVNDNTVNTGQSISIQASQSTNQPSLGSISPVLEMRWSTDQIWSTSDILIGTSISTLGNGINSETEILPYTIPAGSGTRYILIKCDATALVTETNENNNMVVIPITVSSTTSTPDIIISSMSISDLTPNVGQTVLLSCTQSISSATSISAVTLEYRYSTDGTWSNDDVVLGTDVSNIGVSPSSETESITFTFPSGTGNRFLLVKADSPEQITESNETNNVFVLPVVVSTTVTNPDITISSLTSTATNVIVGQSVTVSCQQVISNPPTTTISVSLEYRWSLDLTFDTADLLIGNTISTLGGSTTSEIESITFGIPTGTGTRYLLMKADASNSVTETNESNVYSITYNVSTPSNLPDIFIDEFSASMSSVSPGQQITVNCFQNISDPAYAATNVFMEYRWATGTTYSTSYSIVGVDYSSLGGGDADDDESLTFTVPAGTGQRYIMIKCDSNNGVNESNESNNVYTLPITVVVSALQATLSEYSKLTSTEIYESDQFEENPEESSSSEIEFSFYPNPTRGNIFVNFKNDDALTAQYVIYDMTGHLVQSGSLNSNVTSFCVDVSELVSGTYLFQISSVKFHRHERLIISR